MEVINVKGKKKFVLSDAEIYRLKHLSPNDLYKELKQLYKNEIKKKNEIEKKQNPMNF